MGKRQAVSYLRVSGMGQVEGDGLERQRQAVAAYARSASLALVDEYRDEAVSGTKDLDQREGLSELLARIQANGVRVVVVERADRLARDLMVGELILAEFRKLGAQVVDSAGTDLTAADGDPTRVLIRQVLGAVSQFEKSTIVAKLAAARARKKRATGRCEGRKPFGHRPGEQATLERAQALLKAHKAGTRPAYAAVARALNAEGRQTRTGVPWSPAMVRRVLTRV